MKLYTPHIPSWVTINHWVPQYIISNLWQVFFAVKLASLLKLKQNKYFFFSYLTVSIFWKAINNNNGSSDELKSLQIKLLL